MAYERFGRDRHRPAGEWVHTTRLFNVAGTSYREENVQRFFSAIRAAEQLGQSYGVSVRPDPLNAHDSNALEVFGFAAVKRWFRAPAIEEWHIGYVPADMAESIANDLLAKNVPIAAELYGLYENDGYREVQMFVLAPPGYGFATRLKSSHHLLPDAPEVRLVPSPADIEALAALVARMASSPMIDEKAVRKRVKQREARILERMLQERISSTEATDVGALSFLRRPDAEAYLALIRDSLAEQTKIVGASFDEYLAFGELPVAHYPIRLCIIMRRHKLRELERGFLTSWCRHFPSLGVGASYVGLVERARKLGISEPA